MYQQMPWHARAWIYNTNIRRTTGLMPKRKPIRLEKQRHEVSQYLRGTQAGLINDKDGSRGIVQVQPIVPMSHMT
jgi:hypothetical protein